MVRKTHRRRHADTPNARVRFTLPAGLILLLGLTAAPFRAEASVSGQATITHAEGERGRQLNKANRDDTPFNTYRLLLNASLPLSEHAQLEIQGLLDEGAFGSATNTFLRPWVSFHEVADRKWLNIQAGKLPLMFGTFAERIHQRSNPVIGVPLILNYHTNLRHNLIPVNGDSLVARRGRGQYGVNYVDPKGGGFKGMPILYEACWSTGVEVFGAHGVLEYSGAVTYGNQSNPVGDGQESNDEPGYIGRVGVSRLPGALIGARAGVSASTGAYLPRNQPGLATGHRSEEYDQIVVGTDLEYGVGPLVVRGEAIWNRFETPENTSPERWLPPHLDTFGWYAEAQWTLSPLFSVGGRWDTIDFHGITSPSEVTADWDADVNRFELGAGWRPARAWEIRYAYQGWRYPDDPDFDADNYAFQLTARF